MPPYLIVTNQRQTATKRVVLCCGLVGLSFLAIVWFGPHQRLQAAEDILPDHQVSAVPTKIQPKLVASYGRLPLHFEANRGQTDARVRFLSRGAGYTIFLTADEAVLALRKSQPGLSRLEPFGPVDPRTGRWPSLAGNLKSLWRSLIPDLSQVVPEPNAGKATVLARFESQSPQVMRMRLVGGNADSRVVGLHPLPGRSNYIIGNDPKKWRTRVPSYARVKYESVYPGVDLVYYGNQRQLEYDFVVAPGADPKQIKLNFVGADGMHLDAASGDLVVKVGKEEIRFHKPVVYQAAVAEVSGRRRRSQSAGTAELEGRFILASSSEVAFRVAGYDPKRTLVIDPVLSYSTYLGGSSDDYGNSLAVDAAGNAYVTGYTASSDFPTATPLDQANAGSYDAFVAKLNAAGSALVYSTYLGGSSDDYGNSVAVDASGNAYVTGHTSSTDFPTTTPLQASNGGLFDAFVAKLNPAGGALVFSTYLGGSSDDRGNGIAVDATGNVYVAGTTSSSDFPTATPLQPHSGGGVYDVFVAKLNAAGSSLVYSTYLGGSDDDYGNGIAVDAAGSAYITGYTSSTNFPTANPLQSKFGGQNDAFVAKLNSTGSALTYSSYLGGAGDDRSNGIAVDAAGNAYVTGATQSTDFPTVNAFQGTFGSTSLNDAFVSKVNPTGSALVYSTYLGGSDGALAIAVDAAGDAYVTGHSTAPGFPTVSPLQASFGGGQNDAIVSELDPAGSALLFSTYLGGTDFDYGDGIAVDAPGNVYVTGYTYSGDFPTTPGAFDLSAHVGTCGSPATSACPDSFVSKISPAAALSVSLSPTSLSFASLIVGSTSGGQGVTLTNNGGTALTITSITATGDFSQTNTCGAAVGAGASCAISVTFKPTAGGARTGSVTISDNAPSSPQTITLSGTGQDFTMAAASGSSTSASVAPGGAATYTLTIAALGEFGQAVNFTCTGAPSDAPCQLSASSLTPSSSGTTLTVSVNTVAPSAGLPRSRHLPPLPPLLPRLGGLVMLVLLLAAMAWAVRGRRQPRVFRRRAGFVTFAAMMLVALAMAGCGGGGGGGGGTTSNPGTPAGTYTLTVTGSAGSGSATLSHSVTLTLKVG